MTPEPQIATESFSLGNPDASAAVLLLHGFTGSPWEVRLLGESLAARGFFVHAPRLPGHGQTPEEMRHASADDWKRAAFTAFRSLEKHPVRHVVGLSMGGLLGLLVSAEEKVDKLVMMAPVFGVASRSGRVLKRLPKRVKGWLGGRWIYKYGSDLEDPQAQQENPLLPKYPIERLFDLFSLQDEAAAVLAEGKVSAPVLVIAAEHDHVIRLDRALDAAKRLHARLVVLKRGYHVIPRDTDRALVATEVAGFLG